VQNKVGETQVSDAERHKDTAAKSASMPASNVSITSEEHMEMAHRALGISSPKKAQAEKTADEKKDASKCPKPVLTADDDESTTEKKANEKKAVDKKVVEKKIAEKKEVEKKKTAEKKMDSENEKTAELTKVMKSHEKVSAPSTAAQAYARGYTP